MALINLIFTSIVIQVSVQSSQVLLLSNAQTKLFKDLKYFYNATSVYLVHENYDESLLVTTILFNKLKDLSRVNTLSQVINYMDLSRMYNRTFTHYPRQLFVLPLKSEKNLLSFAEFTKYHVLSFHIWFVMFCESMSQELHNYCENPIKNYFHLQFNTKMVVKCYNNTNLREWYAVNASMEVRWHDMLNWSSNNELILKNEMSIYQRRCDVNGTVLRVSSLKEAENFGITRHRSNRSMFTKMIFELANEMNFKVYFKTRDDYYGIWNKTENKWTGILGSLQSGETDVVAVDMTLTKERLDGFDFASPLILSRTKLYIKEPGSSDVQWNSYLKAFNSSIWISLVILIILSAILLAYMKTKIYKQSYSKNHLLENYLNVWGIYCQQGLADFPDSSPIRIAYVSIIFSAVILSAVYSASVISYLTFFSPTLPFTSLPKFVKDGTYKLIVLQGTAEHEMFVNSQDYVLKRMKNLMINEKNLPLNHLQAFHQICQAKVAFYTTEAMRLKVNDAIPCKLFGAKTGRIENLAFALAKNNPFTEFLSYNIMRFRNNGIMQRMKKQYLKKLIQPPSNYNSVGLWGIAPLITILILGSILSLFILFIEKSYYNFSELNVNKKNHLDNKLIFMKGKTKRNH